VTLDPEYVAQAPQAEDAPPVPGFTGWWDASDPGSIQGGLGNTVATWKDKSGFARHLSQATDAQRPYTGSWNQNGRNVVWTHGKAAGMTGSSPQSGQPYTVVTVGAETSGDGVQRDMWIMRVSTGEGRLYRDGSDSILLYLGAGLSSGRKWEKGRPHVVSSTFNGASSAIGVDGRYSVTGNLGAQNDTGWEVFRFGGEQWFGWIGEIVAYARLLTPSELQLTERYLMRKWGLS
jgi:hypothetical protein